MGKVTEMLWTHDTAVVIRYSTAFFKQCDIGVNHEPFHTGAGGCFCEDASVCAN